MKREKAVSLMAVLVMFFVMAAPVTAAEKSFDVKIPGCAA